MAKKFGKVLFVAAAIGSAVGAACYFLRKKDNSRNTTEEDDYDNFDTDSKESSDGSRSYVALNPESAENPDTAETETPSEEAAAEEGEKSSFTPLTEQVAQSMENMEEKVEEFFDEEDASAEESPISDN